jgi:hypothetical protein
VFRVHSDLQIKSRAGELKADPRFLYDKTFVRTEVLPWYLHYVLDALDRLMVEGIDYSYVSSI